MGAQRLGYKRLRLIARTIDEPVRRGWSNGGYDFEFTTFDHRHGYYSLKTGDVEWAADGECHMASCRVMFPDDFPAKTPEEVAARATALGDHDKCGHQHAIHIAFHKTATDASYLTGNVTCERDLDHGGNHRLGSLSWPS